MIAAHGLHSKDVLAQRQQVLITGEIQSRCDSFHLHLPQHQVVAFGANPDVVMADILRLGAVGWWLPLQTCRRLAIAVLN